MDLHFIGFFFVSLLLLGSSSGYSESDLYAMQQKCYDQNKFPPAEFRKAQQARPFMTTNNNLKCYLSCFLQASGWMTENGTLVENEKLDTDPKSKEVTQKCLKSAGNNKCEKGYSFYKCVVDTLHGI